MTARRESAPDPLVPEGSPQVVTQVARATRTPILSGVCGVDRHRQCGGWWCVCPCHDGAQLGERSTVSEHVEHPWEQVGSCVYCTPCGVRLYQGRVPDDETRPAMAALHDAFHRKIVANWAAMREEVEAARA